MFLLGLFLLSCAGGASRERGPALSRGVETSPPASPSLEPGLPEAWGHEGDDWEPPLP